MGSGSLNNTKYFSQLSSELPSTIQIKKTSPSEVVVSPPFESNFLQKPSLDRIKSDLLKTREAQSDTTKDTKKHKIQKKTNHQLAELLTEENKLLLIDKTLYYWCPIKGYYNALIGEEADLFIRKITPDKYKFLINNHSIRDIIGWLKTNDNLAMKFQDLPKYNDYISFNNGIYCISEDSFTNHDPNYYFFSTLGCDFYNLEYVSGKYFENFISNVTNGNHALYLRLQELFGYIISEIRDVKYIPYLVGPKDTGKSIVIKLFEYLVGTENFTNLNFDQLNQKEFLAELLNKRLNTCGETSELKISRLDNIKKLSGGDYVSARPLFSNPIKFINKAALVFAGNHLPNVKNIDSLEAFSDRLVIFPFTKQIPKNQQDITLLEKLKKETQYILNWSIIGLRRWIDNNFQFTTDDEIEEQTHYYSNTFSTIQSFINAECTFHSSLEVFNSDLYDSYINYCVDNSLTPDTKIMFHRYIKKIPNIQPSRWRDRITKENKEGYKGIGLKYENTIYFEDTNERVF